MPMWRELVALAVVALIVPGAISAFYLAKGNWPFGLIIGVPWLAVYISLSVLYHRMGRLHLAVSLGCAALAVVVVAFASAMGSI
jgi:uncharacterized membrane protein